MRRVVTNLWENAGVTRPACAPRFRHKVDKVGDILPDSSRKVCSSLSGLSLFLPKIGKEEVRTVTTLRIVENVTECDGMWATYGDLLGFEDSYSLPFHPFW